MPDSKEGLTDAKPADSGNSSGGLGDAGSQNSGAAPSWRDSINAEFRNSPTIANIQTDSTPDAINSLASQLVNAQKMVGVDKIPKLKDGASTEEVAAWYQSNMNVPGGADKYNFGEEWQSGTTDDGKAVMTKFEDGQVDLMRSIAHKRNLTQDQATGALQDFMEAEVAKSAAGQDAQNTVNLANMNKLKDAWGLNYENNMALAQSAFDQILPDELREVILKYPEITNHPDFIQHFMSMGEQSLDDSSRNPGAKAMSVSDPNQARAQIEEIKRSPAWDLVLKGDTSAASKHLKTKMEGLYKTVYN